MKHFSLLVAMLLVMVSEAYASGTTRTVIVTETSIEDTAAASEEVAGVTITEATRGREISRVRRPGTADVISDWSTWSVASRTGGTTEYRWVADTISTGWTVRESRTSAIVVTERRTRTRTVNGIVDDPSLLLEQTRTQTTPATAWLADSSTRRPGTHGVNDERGTGTPDTVTGVTTTGTTITVTRAGNNVSTSQTAPWLTQDVLDAWEDGWTGQGVGVGVISNFYGVRGETSGDKAATIIVGGSPDHDIHAGSGAGSTTRGAGTLGYLGVSPGATLYLVNSGSGYNWETSLTGRADNHVEYYIRDNLDIILVDDNNIGQTDSTVSYWTYLIENSGIINDQLVIVPAGDNGLTCASTGLCNGVAKAFADALSGFDYSTFTVQRHAIVVGALNADGTDIASYSNKAGILRNNYIVAPGTFNSATGIGQGTGNAAAVVAGAAALVKHKFGVSNSQVTEILLDTADHLGSCARHAKSVDCTDSTYGHGKLNVEAALSPVGTLN